MCGKESVTFITPVTASPADAQAASAAVIQPHATAKEILAAIDKWADSTLYRYAYSSATSDEPAKLWDVLSALRGPDEPHQQHRKFDTTSIIRAKSLPQLARMNGAAVNHSGELSSVVAEVTGDNGHFSNHVYRAARALR